MRLGGSAFLHTGISTRSESLNLSSSWATSRTGSRCNVRAALVWLSCRRAQGSGRDLQVTFLISTLQVIYYATVVICIVAYTLSLVLLYRTSPRPPSPRMSPLVRTVSLVIPTYNEASVIRQKLENVLQLDYPSEKLEVVVVDSASNDETGSIV